VNVSILNRAEKVRYKDDYEKFKLILNIIGLSMALLNLLINYRALELAFMFLLVWYYCTLTIRESILKVNGSRIKGWWRLHHFISTVCAGVLLIWPQGEFWQLFRSQFMYFNVYISKFWDIFNFFRKFLKSFSQQVSFSIFNLHTKEAFCIDLKHLARDTTWT
jgi:TMPIT-like protein